MFKFNNIENCDLGIIITKSNHRIAFRRDLEFISVPGKTGDLCIDNKRFKNENIEIECIIDASNDFNLKERLNFINNVFITDSYKVLEFDDGFKFNALFIEFKDFEIVIENVLKTKIIFTAYKEDI